MSETSTADWRRIEPVALPVTLAAAKHAFYERGFHGTSIRDIASRAEVSLPTLYYHHENKLGILVALLETAMESVQKRVTDAIAEAATPTAQLSSAIEAIVLHMTGDLELASVAQEFRHLDPADRRRTRYVEMRTEMENTLEDILHRGIDSGEFHIDGEVKEVLRYLLGACQAVTTWYRPSGSRTPAEVAASYAATSLRAVGAQPHIHEPY
ncbi:TetR/AcrR family transcriptional regulator [Gordonia rhizosphera]|uniref:Putative TetR family transcriptional regulator n=1 Tax=Gordonia rhizosphera NBRC 16068 TaxID=1108045 RepID=K6WIL7_9ACTN|nr:TetR/AcrR family transcriptional regulator [Gordonia rhizosphera]GAB92007.1 putative TetR family transcriptional regulator [Gordonia rhizosphera NBRC 16068]